MSSLGLNAAFGLSVGLNSFRISFFYHKLDIWGNQRIICMEEV